MKKEQVKIKKTLSMNDRIIMPQELAEGHFTEDSQGNICYTPYYADITLINVFFLHCVEGLTFDISESEQGEHTVSENVYELVCKDEELMSLYDSFFEVDKESIQECPYKETLLQMYGILSDVDKMVAFKKQQLLHQRENTLTGFIKILTKKLEALDIEKLDFKDAIISALNLPASSTK